MILQINVGRVKRKRIKLPPFHVGAKEQKTLTILYLISIISALAIAWSDIKSRTIPDAWLWPLLLCGLGIGTDQEKIAAAMIGYFLGFVLMILTIKREALGYGDVKLMSVAGLWLGITGLSVSVVTACALGIAWGLIKRQKFVPFAPFLMIGAMGYYLTALCFGL
jgi:prepilin signal peptidase PulO-like enzyme (type II secretory pathway)